MIMIRFSWLSFHSFPWPLKLQNKWVHSFQYLKICCCFFSLFWGSLFSLSTLPFSILISISFHVSKMTLAFNSFPLGGGNMLALPSFIIFAFSCLSDSDYIEKYYSDFSFFFLKQNYKYIYISSLLKTLIFQHTFPPRKISKVSNIFTGEFHNIFQSSVFKFQTDRSLWMMYKRLLCGKITLKRGKSQS